MPCPVCDFDFKGNPEKCPRCGDYEFINKQFINLTPEEEKKYREQLRKARAGWRVAFIHKQAYTPVAVEADFLEKNKSNKNIKTLFLGYQASGKTTFLTAAALASKRGILEVKTPKSVKALAISEDSALDLSDKTAKKIAFFKGPISDDIKISRIDALMTGRPMFKTAELEWYEIKLHIEFEGEDGFLCETLDFPGEISAFSEKEPIVQKMTDAISNADCLYLFFDASLPLESPESLIKDEWLCEQADAIAKARKVFSKKQKSGWPVVVVVTKADLLFAGKPPEIIEKSINKLNTDESLAREKFKSLFRSHAKVILSSQNSHRIKICYVASLGAVPIEKNVIETERGQHKGYTIGNIQEWKPLGLGEVFRAGMLAARTRKKRQHIYDWANRTWATAKYTVYAFILLIIGAFISLFIDNQATQGLKELVSKYQDSKVNAQDVLTKSEILYRPYHPWIYLPTVETIFGKIPDRDDAKWVRDTYHSFTVKVHEETFMVLEKSLAVIKKQKGGLSFSSTEASMREERDKWLALSDNISATITKFATIPEIREPLGILLIRSKNAYIKFLTIASERLWQASLDPLLALQDADKTIMPYLEKINSVAQDIGSNSEFDSNSLASAYDQYHYGRCTVLWAHYQEIASKKPDDLASQFPLLAEVSLKCKDENMIQAAKEKLLKRGKEWDYQESQLIAKLYPQTEGIVAVTSELVTKIQTYITNNNLRKAAITTNYEGRLEKPLELFVKWHNSLDSSYTISSLNLSIAETKPFIQYNCYEVERTKGWNKYKVSVCDPIPPSGSVSLTVAGREIGHFSYSGFHSELPINKSFLWKPGDEIVISVTNQGANKPLVLQNTSYMSLARIMTAGMNDSVVTAQFSGLSLPPLTPSTLPPVDPIQD